MSGTGVYVRYLKDEPREGRTFSEIATDHPMAELPCPGCDNVLGNGQPVTLLVIGPGDDEENQELHRNHRWYNALAIPVHQACLGVGDESR